MNLLLYGEIRPIETAPDFGAALHEHLRAKSNPAVHAASVAAWSLLAEGLHMLGADVLPEVRFDPGGKPRFTDSLLIIFHYICLDWHSVHRRLLQNTHISDSNQTHMQRTWDRRCCERQYIHIFLQLFNLLFMRNSKALLFINDQKTKILKLDIFPFFRSSIAFFCCAGVRNLHNNSTRTGNSFILWTKVL